MRENGKRVAAALLMGFLVPYLLLNTAAWIHGLTLLSGPENGTDPTAEQPQQESVRIQVKQGDISKEMDLEDYLVGVVLGEMPASFESEALKAQAVVARTYTLRRRETATKHHDADVCTDPACCQAYRDPASYDGGKELVDKVRSAVTQTRGQVLTYQGKLIEATYFSSSGGRTEDALAVWGSDLPYLQSTDSPEEGYEDRYMKSVTFTAAEFQEAMGRELSGSCSSWFGDVTYTNGGGVETMVIGGRKYTGTDLRQRLDLRSTAFTVSVSSDTITITTRGYGHRVGMSQYGAEAMAVGGSTYDQILAHYYQGTVLEESIDNQGDLG